MIEQLRWKYEDVDELREELERLRARPPLSSGTCCVHNVPPVDTPRARPQLSADVCCTHNVPPVEQARAPTPLSFATCCTHNVPPVEQARALQPLTSSVCCTTHIPPAPRSYAAVAACAPPASVAQRPPRPPHPSQIRPSTPIGAHPAEAASHGIRRRSVALCRHWALGCCTYGEECRFLHGNTSAEASRVKAARAANPLAQALPPAAGRSRMPRRPLNTPPPSPPSPTSPTGVAIPQRGVFRVNRFAPRSSLLAAVGVPGHRYQNQV